MKRAPKKSKTVRGKGVKGKRPAKKRKAASSDEEGETEDEDEDEAKESIVAGNKGEEAENGKSNKAPEPALPVTSAAKNDDDSSELSSILDDDAPPKKKTQRKAGDAPATKQARTNEEETGDTGDSSSELSSVLDNPPPKKKTKRASKEPTAKKASKGAAAADDGTLSPDEAEIKKLQGQLVKCGVRKIWGIELKKYAGDAKAKIRHLRDMLREIGMDGRFSEAKAREIKERRELAAELEAVNEMNDLWGVGGRRAQRGAAPKKNLKEDTDNEEAGEEDGRSGDVKKKEADGDEDENEDSDAVPKGSNARRRKVRPELAFLGDDSNSD